MDPARPAPPASFYGASRVPLPTGAQAAEFDARAMADLPQGAGIGSGVLMESAGRVAAQVVHELNPTGRIVVLAGSGNNGGDAVVVARTLQGFGRNVCLVVVGERPHPDPLLHGHTMTVRRPDESGLSSLDLELAGAAAVVDGVLGTGIRGAPRGLAGEVLERLESFPSSPPVLALDVPSGVNADTGEVAGVAARARVTLAFGAPKLGSFLGEGRVRSGRVVALDIGFPPWPDEALGARLITPGWATGAKPARTSDAHKKSAGRLLLVAGSPGMAGAAILSARAALRAGVGYLRIATHPQCIPLVQSAVPEALTVDLSDLPDVAADSDALAAGPGMGLDVDASVPAALRALLMRGGEKGETGTAASGLLPPRVLLDADALTLLARGDLTLPDDVEALLTPHPGEAARLESGLGLEDGSSDLVTHRARALAGHTGQSCLLKGYPSVVAPADPGAPLWVSPTSSPLLARAGMGDVLTGVAGALMARGMEAVHAGALGLHLTGRAAEGAGLGDALLPTDVIAGLSRALAETGGGRRRLTCPFVLLDREAPA